MSYKVKDTSIKESERLIRKKYSIDGTDHVNTYLKLTFRKHIALIEDVLKVKKGSKVLDIGCGTGQFLLELVLHGLNATGIDTFEEMDGIDEKIARARFAERGLTPVLVKGNASQMPFHDASFNLVTSFGMLEHIPPYVRGGMLREMFRVVRPGGYLFVIAGPNKFFPYDQHIPKILFANYLPRRMKIALAEKTGTRLLLNVPWSLTRKEIRQAIPPNEAEMINLYSRFLGMYSEVPSRSFSLHPFRLASYLKRTWRLHHIFRIAGGLLEMIHLEHCYILAFRKKAD